MPRLLFSLVGLFCCLALSATGRPNILWIYAEDTSPWMGCYGDTVNAEATPNIDSIANAGVLFTRAFVAAPVCSAMRSAMMVGQNAIRFGAHEHRSSRDGPKIYLPDEYRLLPELLQADGYTTFNHGKTDYNFVWDARAYNYTAKSKTDFSGLVDKQPFFGQIQTMGGKNNTTHFPSHRRVDPSQVTVPADYPDNAIYQQVVAQHYDTIRMDDDLIGEILEGLREAGLDQNTIVVYFSDHGANNLVRHKQMTTEGGLHVPFMVMGPESYVPKSQIRKDLVDLLDLTATTLAWAGMDRPYWYEGRNLFSPEFTARPFVASHKDRLDHTIDRVRSIRSDLYRYIRNYKQDRIFLQPQYRDKKNYTQNLHELYRDGELSDTHRRIYFGERPAEELYDVSVDPEMIHNLAGNPDFSNTLAEHRAMMDAWLAGGDMGAEEESIAALQANGEGKHWGEGVNVEYEVYRADSDGDGLSDKWESLNNRNPEDGRLFFDFNCGGWQTEGWFSNDMGSNLAGYLGYLDFKLDGPTGSIQRSGLDTVPNPADQLFVIRARSDTNLEVCVWVNDQPIGAESLPASAAFDLIRIPLTSMNWKDPIRSLYIQWEGSEGAWIEVDSIFVQRNLGIAER
ncbi:MAG: sulfatase [Coraliomargaritaceae bacterium]